MTTMLGGNKTLCFGFGLVYRDNTSNVRVWSQWGSGIKTVVRGSGAEAAMRGARVSSRVI